MIEKIRAKIYALLYWQTSIGEYLNKWQDVRLFNKYKFIQTEKMSETNFKAHLTKECHIVEKGLSLPNPRAGFGKPKINQLISDTKLYIEKYGESRVSDSVASSLNQYLRFNEEKGEDLSSGFFTNIRDFLNELEFNQTDFGGTKDFIFNQIVTATDFDYQRFISSRVSVRDFSDEIISTEDIEKIIDLARIAPSVCNRQGWHVHAFNLRSDIDKVLQFQHGNRGFGDKIQTLFVVTTDLQSFTKLEGNEPFIDGGIFSMSLLMAIHSLKMGACAMNTCIPFVDEKKLKKMISIPESERLIMMIGVGKLKEIYKVPISHKKEVNEILIIHQKI